MGPNAVNGVLSIVTRQAKETRGGPSRRVFLAILIASRAALGSSPPPSEYEVKAAFLCSFAEYVEWPAGRGDGLTIGILGDDPFGPMLDDVVRNRAVQTKALQVKRLRRVEDARTCQIVYVSGSEQQGLSAILRSLADGAEGSAPPSVLTVSDLEGFTKHGGIIGFVLVSKRVRFQINVRAAERAGLKISSRLLKLAQIVPDDARGSE